MINAQYQFRNREILVDNKTVLVTEECIYYSMCQTGHRSRGLFGGNATGIEAFSVVICFDL